MLGRRLGLRQGRVLLLTAAGAFAWACATAPPRAPAVPEKAAESLRPNIIFILTDDLDSRSISYMPKLQDLLVHGGRTYSNAFVSSPLCAPSRASILTGRFPHNTHVYTNSDPDGGFGVFYRSGQESDTVATRLKAAGYRTALM